MVAVSLKKLFRRTGWTRDQYLAWSTRHARDGSALLVPTSWDGEPCMRVCFVHPQTSLHEVLVLLDDMAHDT